MKKILLFILLSTFAVVSWGQQEILTNNYYYNSILYNPATAGYNQNHQFRLVSRFQWVAFPEAPRTHAFTYNGGFNRVGLGATVMYDQVGPTVRIGGQLDFAYYILNKKKTKFSIGVEGRFLNYRVAVDRIDFYETNDQTVMQALENGSQNVGDASAGAYFAHKGLYAGVSSSNIIQSDIIFGNDDGTRDPLAQLYRHHFVLLGYRWTGKKIDVEPSALLKMTERTGPQIQGGVKLHFLEDQVSVGLAYRSSGFVSFMFRFVIEEQFPILLSFGVATTEFQQHSLVSSELMFGADVLRKEYKVPELEDEEVFIDLLNDDFN